MVSVSRLRGAAIDLGVAQIDRVRDIVSPARNLERLPVVLQGPVRELTSGRPVAAMTLDGIRTVGIGVLARIEAILDHPSFAFGRKHEDDRDDASDDEADCVGCAVFGLLAQALQRVSRQSSVPRMPPLHRLRTYAVQLSRSTTFKVTVRGVQDTATAVLKRLRVQDAKQLLDRVHLNVIWQSKEVILRGRSASAVTSLASRIALVMFASRMGLERLLGERFFAAVFGRNADTKNIPERSATSQAREDLQLELVEVRQGSSTDSDSEDAGLTAAEASAMQSCRVGASNVTYPVTLDGGVEPMEFRLIVKNSFIEFEERPVSSDLRRTHSWEKVRSFGQSSSLNSEPFTMLARWEPPAQPSTSSFQPAPAPTSDPAINDHASSPTPSSPTPSPASHETVLPSPPMMSAPFAGPEAPPLEAEAATGVATAEGIEERTTVMLRNVPTGFTREELLWLLDNGGFRGRYVFVYLPVDFTRSIGLGYALISLETPQDAEMLLRYFDGFRDWARPEHGEDPCEASWSEPRQGLQEHIERYRNSPVMHKSVPDTYKPVLFQGGSRISFPPPTKAIRAPRIRHLKTS